MLLHVELDRGLELPPDGIETGAGHGNADPHFENAVGEHRRGKKPAPGGRGHALENCSAQHFTSSQIFIDLARA